MFIKASEFKKLVTAIFLKAVLAENDVAGEAYLEAVKAAEVRDEG